MMENYPNLKTSENVMQLQEELTSTENRFGFARQFYNDLVANYRTKQEVFPNSIVAGLFTRFEKERYFQIDELERAVPAVDLTRPPA